MKKLEEQYTATDVKLLKHLDRLQDVKNGRWRPITLELAPTNKCNLDCTFCSVKYRDKSEELDYTKLKRALSDFLELGLKSIEITGGGESSLYPKINDLLRLLKENPYYAEWDVGLISNGIELEKRITKENLDSLTWLRISMNGLDYGKKVDLPKIKGTLGLSYVWNRLSNFDTLDAIVEYKKISKADYVRVVPNCLSIDEQNDFKKYVVPVVEEMYSKDDVFAQSKPYSVPNRCWWGYLKPFLNADGYIYRCSANPLLNRKFDERFRMGRMQDIKKIWEDVKPFNTQYCKEGKCFFKPQNDVLEAVMEKGEHEKFI